MAARRIAHLRVDGRATVARLGNVERRLECLADQIVELGVVGPLARRRERSERAELRFVERALRADTRQLVDLEVVGQVAVLDAPVGVGLPARQKEGDFPGVGAAERGQRKGDEGAADGVISCLHGKHLLLCPIDRG